MYRPQHADTGMVGMKPVMRGARWQMDKHAPLLWCGFETSVKLASVLSKVIIDAAHRHHAYGVSLGT
jgi:hypothetical protein